MSLGNRGGFTIDAQVGSGTDPLTCSRAGAGSSEVWVQVCLLSVAVFADPGITRGSYQGMVSPL
ncbi:hypothetical protein SAMN05216604_109173 [Pseudomonas agarici]|nr:hypothetical protein SAMN05216604_109173 [Pseudomonas agarici]